jgi:hypothetical protein
MDVKKVAQARAEIQVAAKATGKTQDRLHQFISTEGRHEQEKGVTRGELEHLVKDAEDHEAMVRAKWGE